MKCEKVRDELAAIALGEPVALAPPVVEHLAACDDCRAAYRRYLSVSESLAAAIPPVEPPSRLREAVLSKARQERLSSGVQPSAPQKTLSLTRYLAGARGWAAAALVLVAVNLGLVSYSLQTQSRLADLESRFESTRREVIETWRAFAGAPAVYAGRFEFADTQAGEGAPREAGGFLYQRPGGWAALIRVEGLDSSGSETYRVWFQEGEAWEDGGPLVVDRDGVGTSVYYAREHEIELEKVWVVKGDVRPGDEDWVGAVLGSGDAIYVEETGTPAPDFETTW